MAMDGTPISATDVARMEAEEELHADRQRRAVLVVAASANGVEDCRLLLSVLGLDADIVAEARRELPAKTPKDPARKRRTRAAAA